MQGLVLLGLLTLTFSVNHLLRHSHVRARCARRFVCCYSIGAETMAVCYNASPDHAGVPREAICSSLEPCWAKPQAPGRREARAAAARGNT